MPIFFIEGEIMKNSDIRMPYPNFQRLDRVVREKKHKRDGQTEDILNELARSICTLNPKLSKIGHNKDIRRHFGDFII
jgi:hypothetical protein